VAKEIRVEKLQAICQNVVENMQDGLACGLVDRNSGLFMAIHHIVPHFSPEYLDAISAAAVELFYGRTVKRVEELLSTLRGTPVQDSFEEMFIASTTVFHFMKYIRQKEVIAILVTHRGVSQGLGWAALRNTLPRFIANLP
jgi:hypothetical protein